MKQTTLSWLCLLGAAFCEMAWTYSLKFLQWTELKSLRWNTFYRADGGLPILAPWICYFVFGIVNTVLLAWAMRTISTSTAFAVWTALTLVVIKVVDVLWLKAGWSWAELLFIGMITGGIVGLKLVASS